MTVDVHKKILSQLRRYKTMLNELRSDVGESKGQVCVYEGVCSYPPPFHRRAFSYFRS